MEGDLLGKGVEALILGFVSGWIELLALQFGGQNFRYAILRLSKRRDQIMTLCF